MRLEPRIGIVANELRLNRPKVPMQGSRTTGAAADAERESAFATSELRVDALLTPTHACIVEEECR